MAADNNNNLGEQETLVPGADVVSDKPVADFPDELAQRFQLIDTLGQGGAGTVFLVFDQNLQRQVALKLLSAPQADMQLLLMEARAQAKLKHPHICPIFDVGQCQQQVFMVMQFVPGLPLHKLAPQLSLEQKLIVMEQVCLGLQHAHSNSLIHRDIKPSNILVEQDENGQLHAYIVDFGLAHQQQQQQSLAHQAGLGTPQFMAPEQLQKQAADTDRRVDIYSIGASLYQLICGQAPVCIGDTSKAEMADTVSEDINRLAKRVAEDLQTIILKCLEPQASLRYSSAREVALELRRYLEGEPIKAHRGLSYRLGKKLRKHKLVVGLVAMVLMTLAGSGGYQLYQQHQQQIREQLLQDFTADVENLEARVRFTHMSPQQDISGLKQQWRTQVEDIQNNMQMLGDIASGPGNYAIGRMLYAFQQYEPALEHLQQAWDGGFQQPRVAYILGLTLAELYQVKSLQALNIESKKSRQLELERLDRDYRQPAMDYLQQSNQLAQYQGYASALALYLQQDYQQAINELEQAKLPPWFYEKQQLLARLTLQQAEDLYANGEKQQANKLYQQALTTSEQGLNVAPNSMQMHNIYASILLRQVANKMYDQGSPITTINSGLAATKAASQIDNLQLDNTLLRADFLYRKSTHLLSSNDQALAPINKELIQLLELSLKQWENDSRLLRFLGSAYYQQFSLSLNEGKYNQVAVDKAFFAFNLVPTIGRDYRYNVVLGKLYLDVAKNRRRFHLGRGEYYDLAFEKFEQAKKIGVENPGMHINYAAALINLAKADFNPNSRALLNKSIEELNLVRGKKQLAVASGFYMAKAYYELALWEKNLSNEYISKLKVSKDFINKALLMNDDNYLLWNRLAKIDKEIFIAEINERGLGADLENFMSLSYKIYSDFSNHSASANDLGFYIASIVETIFENNLDAKFLLKKSEFFFSKLDSVESNKRYQLSLSYFYYLKSMIYPNDDNFNLTRVYINRANGNDDWSLDLKAKVYLLLALTQKQKQDWLTALMAINGAIKQKPYKMEYYSRRACILEQAKLAGVSQEVLGPYSSSERPDEIKQLRLKSCQQLLPAAVLN